MSDREPPASEVTVVPVVGEELSATLRERETERVRVRKRVEESEAELEIHAAHDEVDVERVPIGRLVEAAPELRVEGDTTVIPVLEETVVFEKRLLLREEIRVTKRRVDETKRVRAPVRKEQVDVERELAADEPAPAGQQRRKP